MTRGHVPLILRTPGRTRRRRLLSSSDPTVHTVGWVPLLATLGVAFGLGLAVALPRPAAAQTAEPDGDSAIYVAIAGFGAIENHDYRGYSTSSGGGFNFRLGYQWNRWLALDIAYELGVFGISPSFDDPPADNTSLLTHFFPISASIFFLDFGEKSLLGRVHPVATIGIGPMWARVGQKQYFPNAPDLDNRRGMVWQAGIGMEVEASEKIRGFVEGRYAAGMGSIDEIRYFTVGLGMKYRF